MSGAPDASVVVLASLDPARPVLHVAGALRIDRYGGRDSVRLQIDDAAPAAGSVLA